jgi:hypothetical protein
MLVVPRQGELLLEHARLEASFLPRLRSVYSAYPPTGDLELAACIVPEAVARALCIIGDVHRARERLDEYLRSGASTLVLAPRPAAAVVECSR